MPEPKIQSSAIRNTPDIQGSRYDVWHCYHDATHKELMERDAITDQVVCCWCGRLYPKFRQSSPIGGHGPYAPTSLWMNTRDDDRCPGDKAKSILGGQL